MSSTPGVTCVCPTSGRFQFICEAIHQFLAQDYPHKKLLIFNNGDQPLKLDPSLENENITLVNAGPNFSTYGEILSAALNLVDTQYIAHWDDDDIYLSNHLSTGIRELEKHDGYCFRSTYCLFAGSDGKGGLEVVKASNVLEATWIMRTDFVKLRGYNIASNVGAATGIMTRADIINKMVDFGDYVTFVYRWGLGQKNMSSLKYGEYTREKWLEQNSDYGDGKCLVPKSTDELRDRIIEIGSQWPGTCTPRKL